MKHAANTKINTYIYIRKQDYIPFIIFYKAQFLLTITMC